MNPTEKMNRTETTFEVIDKEVLEVCREYEHQTSEQSAALSDLGGPSSLGKFGMFRSSVQMLLDETRLKINHAKSDSMRSAFRAMLGNTFHDFESPVTATMILGKR